MNSTASDERAIINLLGDFARILDRKQWSRVGEVFADDLTFNYGDNQEQAGGAALLVNFRKYLDNCGATQHLLGSIQIELDGDRAVSRSYVQARHQGKGAKAHLFLDTNGEYVDRWERRAEGWRIVRRDARFDLFSGDMAVLAP
jgi:ketosteroid isomerase-like protein